MNDRSDPARAFDELFAAHYSAVYRYAVRRAPRASVEDVLAETFLVAWRRADRVPDDALPWLLGVARHVLANQRRGERRRAALLGRLRATWTARAAEWEPPGTLSSELAEALASLSEREREALF